VAAEHQTVINDNPKQDEGAQNERPQSERPQGERYDPAQIEPKWQNAWSAAKLFENYGTARSTDDSRPKFYYLDMFPYPRLPRPLYRQRGFILAR
jgi:leucyl-tRNA synthetase